MSSTRKRDPVAAPGRGGGSSSRTPAPDYPNSKYDLQRASPKTPGLDVRLFFQDSKVRAHKVFLLGTSEFWFNELSDTGSRLVCIDMTKVDTTPEAADRAISYIYGKPFEELGITTGENIQSFLNAMIHFQMDEMLEQLLAQKLFKMSEFWELDNKYIYKSCLPYLYKKTMEDAFLDWILEDLTNRRQHFDKFCDLKQLKQEQKLTEMNDLLDTRNEKIQQLENKIKQLGSRERLRIKSSTSTENQLKAQIQELEARYGETKKEIEDLKAKFRGWTWIFAGQLKETINEKNKLMTLYKFEKVSQAQKLTNLRLELEETNTKLQDSQQLCLIREAKLKEISEQNEQLKESQQQQHRQPRETENEMPINTDPVEIEPIATKRSKKIIKRKAPIPMKKTKITPSPSSPKPGSSNSNRRKQNLSATIRDEFDTMPVLKPFKTLGKAAEGPTESQNQVGSTKRTNEIVGKRILAKKAKIPEPKPSTSSSVSSLDSKITEEDQLFPDDFDYSPINFDPLQQVVGIEDWWF